MRSFDKALLEDIKARVPIHEVADRMVSWDKQKSNPGRKDYWAKCPVHRGDGVNFHCDSVKGFAKCFACGWSGDAIKLLQDVDGLSFTVAVAHMAEFAGIDLKIEAKDDSPEAKRRREARRVEFEQRRAAQDAEAEAEEKRKLESAGAIWRATVALQGTPAEAYLLSRGMAPGQQPNLRYHPDLACRVAGKVIGRFGALVGRVQDAEGAGRAIWRIFVHPDGRAVTGPDGKKVKLGFGPAAGGAVRLTDDAATKIGIGEGVESSIAANILDRRLPVWAGLSTSGIIGFQPPSFVRFVRIFPDGDLARRRAGRDHEPSGMEAARRLEHRLREEGRVRCEIVPPPHNADYADLLKSILESSLT